MAVVTNGILLLVSLFTFSQIYGIVRRNVSKAPYVASVWTDLLTGKSERSVIQWGYDTYSKASKIFRISHADSYLVPPSLFPEVRKLPSTVLDSSAANEEIMSLERCLGDGYIDVVPFVRQNVIRSIATQVSPVREEISYQFRKNLCVPGESAAWRSVPVWATTFPMMTSIAARFFVGKPLCRDEQFIKKMGEFTRAVSIESLLLQKVPKIVRPVVAKFLKSKQRVRAIKEMLREPVMACLTETDDGKIILKEREHYPDGPMLPQFVAYVLPKYSDPAKTGPLTKEKILDQVVGRNLALFFAAIDTTTMTFSQSFLDIASHPRAQYADKLRDEAKRVLQAHNGEWSAAAVGELKLLDSFIKESQRLHPVGTLLAARKVMTPGGLTFSNGDHVPQGAIIQLPTWFVQTDSSIYENAEKFDGFRFVNDKHPESVPSDTFLSFGHGNHSCPGRRFALVMVKLMLLELLLNYEYEELDERPADFLFGPGIMPDIKKEVKTRPVQS